MSVRSLALPLALIAAAPALAQESAEPGDPARDAQTIDPATLEGDSLMIGLGAGLVPSYEGSDDTVWSVVPGVRGRFSQINFTLRGNRFWADLIPTPGGPGWDFQLGPIVQANFNRSAAIKDVRVKALGRIKTAIEVGGFIGLGKQGVITSDYDKLTASIGFVHDAGGIHRSYVITPSIDYGTPLSRKAYVGLSLSANYMGGGYADTYFGVTPAGSAASGLPAFTGSKGWKDWTLGAVGSLALIGDLTGGLSLVGGASYRRLLGDAADSPVTRIAGSRNQWAGALGFAYTF